MWFINWHRRNYNLCFVSLNIRKPIIACGRVLSIGHVWHIVHIVRGENQWVRWKMFIIIIISVSIIIIIDITLDESQWALWKTSLASPESKMNPITATCREILLIMMIIVVIVIIVIVIFQTGSKIKWPGFSPLPTSIQSDWNREKIRILGFGNILKENGKLGKQCDFVARNAFGKSAWVEKSFPTPCLSKSA